MKRFLFRKPRVEVLEDIAGGWYWRKVNPWNLKIVGDSGESYVRKHDAKKAAIRENPGCTVVVKESK